jgi:hypothetical protein
MQFKGIQSLCRSQSRQPPINYPQRIKQRHPSRILSTKLSLVPLSPPLASSFCQNCACGGLGLQFQFQYLVCRVARLAGRGAALLGEFG